jgi:hypothetical protein
MKKARYNSRLLPRKRYKIITHIDSLGKYYLTRLPSNGQWYIESSEELENHIDRKELERGLSVNLLSVYTHKDAKIRAGGNFKDSHHQLWKVGASYIKPPYIKYKRRANFFGIQIKDVINCKMQSQSLQITFINGGVRYDQGFLKVVHRPTYCNFWHFEIRIWAKTQNGTAYELSSLTNVSKTGLKRYCKQAADTLRTELVDKLKRFNDCKVIYLPKKYYK